MRVMFPTGIKIKNFNNKTNILAQTQSTFDKEINTFYIPLTKEPFEKKIKRKSIKKETETNKTETKERKETKEKNNKTKKQLK
jgi:hypothetical protein